MRASDIQFSSVADGESTISTIVVYDDSAPSPLHLSGYALRNHAARYHQRAWKRPPLKLRWNFYDTDQCRVYWRMRA